jgi:hypothetical protein
MCIDSAGSTDIGCSHTSVFFIAANRRSLTLCDGVFHLVETSEEEARMLHGMLHDFLSSADSFRLCQEEER